MLASTSPQKHLYLARRVLVSVVLRSMIQYNPKADRVAAAVAPTTTNDLRMEEDSGIADIGLLTLTSNQPL